MEIDDLTFTSRLQEQVIELAKKAEEPLPVAVTDVAVILVAHSMG